MPPPDRGMCRIGGFRVSNEAVPMTFALPRETGGAMAGKEDNAVSLTDARRGTNRSRLAAVLMLMVCVFAGSGREADARELVASKESLYNNIYVFKDGDDVAMTFGFNKSIYTESIFNTLDDRDLPVVYTRFMTASLMYPKKLESVLEIGFGGGRTSWYLHRFLPNIPVTSVELDQAVIDLAHQYFGIKDETNYRTVNSDGRIFLSNSKDRYDVILIDAYRGPFVPFHLLTKEFYQIVKDHLAEGGVIAQNVEPSTMLFDSAVRTMNAVFPQVDFYLAEGNVVTIGYDGAELTGADLDAMAAKRDGELQLRYSLTSMLPARKSLASSSAAISQSAKILTDDFSPVESLKAIQQHNRKWSDPK
jgi:spermidine synthase